MIHRLFFNAYWGILVVGILACGDGNVSGMVENESDEAGTGKVVAAVTELVAMKTNKANELQITWENLSDIVSVAISYWLDDADENAAITTNVRVNGTRGTCLLKLPQYGVYRIATVAIDNYGIYSEKVMITATPAREDIETSYEIVEDKLPIADSYVLCWEGKYYAYGTRINGFEVYISTDLKHWRRNDVKALDPENSWGAKWFWAPEVYYVKSKNLFYLFYSVDEHLCVATATSPEGPFVQSVKKPIVEDEKGIDSTLFIDDDGTPYLYYVRFTDGNVIWVAEMNDDLKSIKKETLTKCVSATDVWEKKQAKVAEGPSVLKKGRTYYLVYSANHYESQDYAVGYATATSPKGPWTKYSGNPILRRDKEAVKALGLVGTGHGAPFMCTNGSYKYIFHAHASISSIGPRTSYIGNFEISDNGIISITGEIIAPVRIEEKLKK